MNERYFWIYIIIGMTIVTVMDWLAKTKRNKVKDYVIILAVLFWPIILMRIVIALLFKYKEKL